MSTELSRYLEKGFRGSRPIKLANSELAHAMNQAGLGTFNDHTPTQLLAVISRTPQIEILDLPGEWDTNEMIRWARFVEQLRNQCLERYKAMNGAFTQLLGIEVGGRFSSSPFFNDLGKIRTTTLEDMVTFGLNIKIARFFSNATRTNV